MTGWTHKTAPWMEFGAGSFERLGAIAETYGGQKVVVIVDAGIASLVVPRVRHLLGPRLALLLSYDRKGEPTIQYLDELANAARDAQADSVIGIGGGSAMDTAKAVAVLLTNDGSGGDYQGLGKVGRRAAPCILVPTTAGSGSEATWSAVMINEATGVKRGINGHHVFASATILDPELTLSLPPRQTAVSGMDALSHAVESYTCRNATPLSRLYSEEAMRRLFTNLPLAVQQPKDIEVRGAVLLGSFLAGVAIINAEVGLSHAMSYPLSVRHGVPHGLGNAVLLPATSEFNAQAVPELYARIGEFARPSAPVAASEFGAFLRELLSTIGLDGESLQRWGVSRSELPDLANEALTMKGPIDNHQRPVDRDSVLAIYESVY